MEATPSQAKKAKKDQEDQEAFKRAAKKAKEENEKKFGIEKKSQKQFLASISIKDKMGFRKGLMNHLQLKDEFLERTKMKKAFDEQVDALLEQYQKKRLTESEVPFVIQNDELMKKSNLRVMLDQLHPKQFNKIKEDCDCESEQRQRAMVKIVNTLINNQDKRSVAKTFKIVENMLCKYEGYKTKLEGLKGSELSNIQKYLTGKRNTHGDRQRYLKASLEYCLENDTSLEDLKTVMELSKAYGRGSQSQNVSQISSQTQQSVSTDLEASMEPIDITEPQAESEPMELDEQSEESAPIDLAPPEEAIEWAISQSKLKPNQIKSVANEMKLGINEILAEVIANIADNGAENERKKQHIIDLLDNQISESAAIEQILEQCRKRTLETFIIWYIPSHSNAINYLKHEELYDPANDFTLERGPHFSNDPKHFLSALSCKQLLELATINLAATDLSRTTQEYYHMMQNLSQLALQDKDFFQTLKNYSHSVQFDSYFIKREYRDKNKTEIIELVKKYLPKRELNYGWQNDVNYMKSKLIQLKTEQLVTFANYEKSTSNLKSFIKNWLLDGNHTAKSFREKLSAFDYTYLRQLERDNRIPDFDTDGVKRIKIQEPAMSNLLSQMGKDELYDVMSDLYLPVLPEFSEDQMQEAIQIYAKSSFDNFERVYSVIKQKNLEEKKLQDDVNDDLLFMHMNEEYQMGAETDTEYEESEAESSANVSVVDPQEEPAMMDVSEPTPSTNDQIPRFEKETTKESFRKVILDNNIPLENLKEIAIQLMIPIQRLDANVESLVDLILDEAYKDEDSFELVFNGIISLAEAETSSRYNETLAMVNGLDDLEKLVHLLKLFHDPIKVIPPNLEKTLEGDKKSTLQSLLKQFNHNVLLDIAKYLRVELGKKPRKYRTMNKLLEAAIRNKTIELIVRDFSKFIKVRKFTKTGELASLKKESLLKMIRDSGLELRGHPDVMPWRLRKFLLNDFLDKEANFNIYNQKITSIKNQLKSHFMTSSSITPSPKALAFKILSSIIFPKCEAEAEKVDSTDESSQDQETDKAAVSQERLDQLEDLLAICGREELDAAMKSLAQVEVPSFCSDVDLREFLQKLAKLNQSNIDKIVGVIRYQNLDNEEVDNANAVAIYSPEVVALARRLNLPIPKRGTGTESLEDTCLAIQDKFHIEPEFMEKLKKSIDETEPVSDNPFDGMDPVGLKFVNYEMDENNTCYGSSTIVSLCNIPMVQKLIEKEHDTCFTLFILKRFLDEPDLTWSIQLLKDRINDHIHHLNSVEIPKINEGIRRLNETLGPTEKLNEQPLHAPSAFNDNNQKDASEFLDALLETSEPLRKLFTFTRREFHRCQKCGQKHNSHEDEITKLNDMPKTKNLSIRKVIKESRNVLAHHPCPCGHQWAETNEVFLTLPDVLHVKLNCWGGPNFSKIEHSIKPTPKVLFGNQVYEICSVGSHHGLTQHSGHYTAEIYDSKTSKWMKTSDDEVSPLSIENEPKSNAYMLFYQRCNDTSFISTSTLPSIQAEQIPSTHSLPSISDVETQPMEQDGGDFAEQPKVVRKPVNRLKAVVEYVNESLQPQMDKFGQPESSKKAYQRYVDRIRGLSSTEFKDFILATTSTEKNQPEKQPAAEENVKKKKPRKNARPTEEEINDNIKKLKEIHRNGIEELNAGGSNVSDLCMDNPVVKLAKRFEEIMKENFQEPKTCVTCQAAAYDLTIGPQTKMCDRCARESRDFKKKDPERGFCTFSADNFMIPSAVPEELQDLSFAEECAIKLACPLIHVYSRKGQTAIKGNCIGKTNV